jgi:hypothetical protein
MYGHQKSGAFENAGARSGLYLTSADDCFVLEVASTKKRPYLKAWSFHDVHITQLTA